MAIAEAPAPEEPDDEDVPAATPQRRTDPMSEQLARYATGSHLRTGTKSTIVMSAPAEATEMATTAQHSTHGAEQATEVYTRPPHPTNMVSEGTTLMDGRTIVAGDGQEIGVYGERTASNAAHTPGRPASSDLGSSNTAQMQDLPSGSGSLTALVSVAAAPTQTAAEMAAHDNDRDF